MHKYPVEIELLSETIFGNGESKNGVVNTDILVNNEGEPYYSGKTFKGCLKKSINDILKPLYKSKNEEDKFNKKIDLLFGIGAYNKADGKLKFSNFYLHDEILDVFNNNHKFNKNCFLDVLTDIRFSVKIDEELGVSKDGSLRTARVLKKGLVFVGFIECEESLDDEEYKFLERGIKSLKNLGVNKSRGKGQVKVSIYKDDNKFKNEMCVKGEAECNYLFYKLNLNEPVKIGNSNSKYDYEESNLYITGSAMRGAIINRYSNEEDLELDILKNVYFSDAYPIYMDNEERYSFPTPNVFVISKDTDKSDKKEYSNDMFSNVLDKKDEDIKERRVIKLKKGSFSYYIEDEKTLYQFDVNKDFRFHHTRNKEKENIFRYEAISKDQQFYGVIDISKLNDSNKEKVINVFKSNPIIYLGGSRNAGYGRTEITYLEEISTFNQLQSKLNYLKCVDNAKEYNDIYLLSDVILRDENHQVVSNFTKEYLKEKLGANKVEFFNSQINPTVIKGFNSKWRSHIPQLYAMGKGSVIRIKGDFDKDKIKKFITTYHGDKIQDGLGRVIINPIFLDVKIIKYKDYKNTNKKSMKNIIKPVDKSFIRKLNNLKVEYMNDMEIKKYIDKNIHVLEDPSLTLSQISNVLYEIDSYFIGNNGLEDYLEKLNEISTNKLKTENNSKILNITISKNIKLKDILNDNVKLNKKEELINEVLKENIENKYISQEKIKEKDFIKKILLKILKEYLYYKTKIMKLETYKIGGDKSE